MAVILLALAGWVLDPTGPVAGAEVRVVELKPMTCPCAPAVEEIGYGNEVPDCHCPAALDMWRKRLASCTWPRRAVQVTRTDKQGRIALDGRVAGNAIEAWTATAVKWLAVPASADRVGIELEPAVRPRLIVDTPAELHAALMFEDGHCVPMQRETKTTWLAAAPFAKPVDSWPTLVIEAKGFATVVRTWYEDASEPLQLALGKAEPIRGSCRGDRVEVENPFQSTTVPVMRGAFRVDGVIDSETTLRCMRGNTAVEEWSYTTADGLQESGGLYGGLIGDDCHVVEVVDRAGKPLANAEVSVYSSRGGGNGMSWATGTSGRTDASGKACVYEMYEGYELVVHPPPERGGACAGESKLRLTAGMLRAPLRVRVDVASLQRARWRGRVLTPEKLPVAGAGVTITSVEPGETKSCSDSAEITVQTGVDGRFELPLVPVGKATIRIGHDWYLPLEIDTQVPAPERELVLDRGATLSGRVVDSSGTPIDRCIAMLYLADQRNLIGSCTASGYSFRTIVPGDARLEITRLDAPNGARPDERQLVKKIKLGAARTLVHDVTWPVTSRAYVIDAP